jgi:UDP-glucose 4-epimerase
MEKISNKKILIVGGAGFVGSNLCRHLLKNYNPKAIIVIDNLLSSNIENLPIDLRVKFIFGSIADCKTLEQIPTDIDFVFHLACYHGNQSSINDPLSDHQNNTLTSLMLFNHISRFLNLKKVVYAAAGCAVAEKTFENATATDEEAPVSLFHDSPYSISKLIGEMYGNYYWKNNSLPFVKARFQNVYGPYEVLGAGQWRGTIHTVWRNVVPSFIWKSMKKEALPVENGGITSRDFIYVEDLVRGLVACAVGGVPGEAYNLASGLETTIGDLAQAINSITGNTISIELLPARDWDRSGKRFGSTVKAKKELGFVANTSLIDGLNSTVYWTKENTELIQRSIFKHEIFLRG